MGGNGGASGRPEWGLLQIPHVARPPGLTRSFLSWVVLGTCGQSTGGCAGGGVGAQGQPGSYGGHAGRPSGQGSEWAAPRQSPLSSGISPAPGLAPQSGCPHTSGLAPTWPDRPPAPPSRMTQPRGRPEAWETPGCHGRGAQGLLFAGPQSPSLFHGAKGGAGQWGGCGAGPSGISSSRRQFWGAPPPSLPRQPTLAPWALLLLTPEGPLAQGLCACSGCLVQGPSWASPLPPAPAHIPQTLGLGICSEPPGGRNSTHRVW